MMSRILIEGLNRASALKRHWRGRRRVGIVGAGAFSAVWLASLLLPRTYEAVAAFRAPAEQSPVARAVTRPRTLEAVLDDPDLPFASRFPRDAAGQLTGPGEKLRDQMIGRLLEQTTLGLDDDAAITVTVRDRDPQQAAQLANGLVEAHLAALRQSRASAHGESAALIADRLQAREQELAALGRQLADLEQAHPALAQDATRDEAAAARAELRDVEQRLLQIEQEHLALVKWAGEQPDQLEQRTRGRNPQVARLNDQKSNLEQELNEHRYKWGRTDDHPLVRKTQEKLAALEARIAATPAVIDLTAQRQDNAAKLEAQARIQSLAAVMNTLAARRDQLHDELGRLTPRRVNLPQRDEHADLSRRIADARRDLDLWQDKQRDLLLAASTAGAAEPVVTRRAIAPRRPITPPRGAATTTALLVGAMAGAATWRLTREKPSGFDSLDAAERELGLAVLGTINELPAARRTGGAATRRPARRAA